MKFCPFPYRCRSRLSTQSTSYLWSLSCTIWSGRLMSMTSLKIRCSHPALNQNTRRLYDIRLLPAGLDMGRTPPRLPKWVHLRLHWSAMEDFATFEGQSPGWQLIWSDGPWRHKFWQPKDSYISSTYLDGKPNRL